jgi:hypothetical protein
MGWKAQTPSLDPVADALPLLDLVDALSPARNIGGDSTDDLTRRLIGSFFGSRRQPAGRCHSSRSTLRCWSCGDEGRPSSSSSSRLELLPAARLPPGPSSSSRLELLPDGNGVGGWKGEEEESMEGR